MITDFFKLSYQNLLRRKLRSILTMTGIVISIATIFVLFGLSIGLDSAVKEQFRLLGTDKFFVQPKGQAGFGGGGAVELTIDDSEVVEKVRGVNSVAYFVIGNAKIEYRTQQRFYMVLGLPGNKETQNLIFEAMNLEMDEGRFLKQGDKNKIVIGYSYKYANLFEKPLRVRDTIKLNEVEFEVVGILEQIGNPQDDQQVYINMDDFKDLFDSGDRVDMLWVQTKEGEDLNFVADEVKRRLMRSRGVTEKTIDFEILTPEEMLASFGTILNIITVFLVGIAGISLFVGGVGIANTMYTSVLERTKEIGTMKAIGAKNSDIITIFVTESGLLGIIGGAVGIILGIGIAKLIDYIAAVQLQTTMLQTATPLYLIIGCLMFSFLIGAVSGYLPARQAAKIRPAETLRYE
ncbi:ABC transporter permease [Candidatus Pacearchaeota archaeon]|nr:ABC transporter permease [Candidatus Pacearchaeota archaeon]